MADKSEHARTDGGQPSYPAYDRLRPSRADSRSEGDRWEEPIPPGEPGPREALFAHLFQISSDGIVLHELLPAPKIGRFIDVNGRLCQMLGYTREEVLKLTLLDILGEEARAAIPKTVHHLRQSGRLLLDTVLIRKDGQTVPVEVSIDTVEFQQRRMTLSVIRDITGRKRLQERLEAEVRTRTQELSDTVRRLQEETTQRTRAERELRKRSQMLESFFRDTITPLAFLDRHVNFVRVNEAYARAAGKRPDYFVGRNYFTLYPDEEIQAIFTQTVRRRQAYHAHARPFTYPDQPERGITYWDWRLTPFCDEAGPVQFLVLSLDDVTQQQKAVRELERRSRQLQKIARELLEAEDRERRRLAEILHDDVQQILAAAKFQAGLLDGRVQGDKNSVEIVAEIKQMLRDAIEKSRSLSHELGPALLSQSSLSDTFAWLAQQMETKHGLVVRLETRGSTESFSEPVRTFLYRAAREILFNVVKHAAVTEAQLRLRRVRNRLRLTISDKGQGFDPRSLGTAGGFGLLNVRERTEFLGGHMRIKSTLGKGSTFSIAVPDTVASAD